MIDVRPALPRTREHFEVLDGLRGVAAVAIVIFHFMEFVVPDYEQNFIAHGYLAVDFFFCLSGFVIAYAYEADRMRSLGFRRFVELRLIRLHPLVLLGALIGLLTFLLDPFKNLHAAYSIARTTRMYLSASLLIPWPDVPERYFNLFYLNPPTWSLFWEYLANVAYALLLFRASNRTIASLVGLAAAMLCVAAFHYDGLAVGWGGQNFWGGGFRILYSFPAGILLFRFRWILRTRLGFAATALLLVAAFLIPYSERTSRFVDPLVVILYFPFLVATGAGAPLHPTLRHLCRFSGNISYPLYTIHYPLLWMFLSYVEARQPTIAQSTPIILVGTVLLVALAYGVFRCYDLPVRRYLRRTMIAYEPVPQT